MLFNPERQDIVWGVLANFTGPARTDELSLPIDSTDLRENRDSLIPAGLLDHITIIPGLVEMQLYTRFLKTMKNHGYVIGDINHPRPGDNFFIFYYDWRRPFDENALRLAETVNRLKQMPGRENAKFDVIAHSSAVFLARYYALYGGRDLRSEKNPAPDYEGAKNIRKLILINPAHEGLLYVFRILNEGFTPAKGPLFRRFTPQELFTMPAFFGLLPRYDTQPFVDASGNVADLDLYDAGNWVRYGWSVFSPAQQALLESQMKRRFPLTWQEEMKSENEKRKRYLEAALAWAKFIQSAVSEKLHPLPAEVKTYVFATEWGPTPERVCIMKEDKKLDFGDGKSCNAQLFSSGDNMVTSSSLRGHYTENPPQYIFLKEQHRKIANNKKIHRHIIRILWDSKEDGKS
jgi:hypothetical protein